MKTGITVISTIQTGFETWSDIKTTKVFDDETKIGEIKEWMKIQQKLKCGIDEIGISGNIISDLK